MYLFENIIIPLYGSWLYSVASYYDFAMNRDLYIHFPGGLSSKVDGIVESVFGWLPASLCFITTVRPVEVWMDPWYRELTLVALNVVFGDIWFYTLHRTLHHPLLYRFHKKHHEAKNPVGVLALYAHPFDAIVVNLGSMMALHLWLRFSFFQIMCIGTMATVNTIVKSHTGRKTDEHVIHHQRFTCNYGMSLFMDKLFGTYVAPLEG